MIWLIIISFMIIGWLVQYRLKSRIKKYSQTPIGTGITGAEIAAAMLRDHGINDVRITCVPGKLTDHYNPANKTVNLSEMSYYGNSAASAAIAAHETGHAVQHAKAYAPLKLRSMLVPVQNISSQILNVIFIISFIGAGVFSLFPVNLVLQLIVLCYAAITLFSLVTLPVEYDASNRALLWIKSNGVVDQSEYGMAKKALNSAASTYLVAALSSLTMLLYYLSMMLGRD